MKKTIAAIMYGAFAMSVSTWIINTTRKKAYSEGFSDGAEVAMKTYDMMFNVAKAVNGNKEES